HNATSIPVSIIVATPSPHFGMSRGRRVLTGSRRVGFPHLVLRNDLANCGAGPGGARFPHMGFIGRAGGLKVTCREQGRRLEDWPGNSYNLSALVALGAPRHSAIITPSSSAILLSRASWRGRLATSAGFLARPVTMARPARSLAAAVRLRRRGAGYGGS